ncbi:MAG: DUF72 domain-containing protein [Gemmatimonadetes bacterium]|nr:DUF72 domain-containing protein [Gemmatimonadota bacterium]NIR78293.1 DUF72 domain-containing protein [Gemmatimonadota bacterium]NIT86879.1 DUF72 domain-containing protein [Gemmatimonadota bacterium]NIU31225.1 DUF72 domain-containing protein [Gemmatimonadota bacterium]NIU35535.1 DUF72 domain-containing protein [Gemmatimonadota bacterium]
MSRERGRFLIGTSGFHYDHWRGVFYPPRLPKEAWFGHYARRFETVEINNTFYGLPEPETVDAWRERAPEGFVYAVKFSRYGSHMKKLKAPEETIPNFLSRLRRLQDHLGPILVQLPPRWRADPERLDAFLACAPEEERWALEFRDPSWLADEVFDVLESRGAALCVHDMLPDHPRRPTADFIYLRFHGPGEERYQGSYPHQALTAEARRIADELDEGLDVYAYFNNDPGGRAVDNARDLRRYVRRALKRGNG